MDDSCLTTSQQVEFIDDSAIHWPDVRRTRTQFYQRFQYEYPGPIQNLKQRLVIVPADRYGAQQLLDHHLVVNPLPAAVRQVYDTFGNRILELEVSEADQLVSFETLMIVESADHERQRPAVSAREARHFLKHTPLTMPDTRIRTVAQELKSASQTQHDLAHRINDWVFGAMRYGSGTTVKTTAAQALEQGQGLCQDYSHIMLAMCRTVGLPARYISGHLLGEGGSHAWVEVALPTKEGLQAFAFDPTNHCQPHLGYVTVAVGRDYADVSPTSGTFTAPYSGHLTCRKRAGLTLVEYHSGEIAQSKTLL